MTNTLHDFPETSKLSANKIEGTSVVTRRGDQISAASELLSSGRSVVITGERNSGRTTALRALVNNLGRASTIVSASETARAIPLGALAALVRVPRGLSSTDRVATAIEELRAARALVVVDDADLLDDESSMVLLALAPNIPILLTVNNRSQRPDAVERIFRDFAVTIELAPLDAKQLLDIAERSLGGLVDLDSVALLCDDGEGSPGHLVRRIAQAQRDGTLHERHGVWAYQPLVSAGDPDLDAVLRNADAALRRGAPDAAARLLATLLAAPHQERDRRHQQFVSAQLRWALAWAGKASRNSPSPTDANNGSSASLLADARAAAEIGDDATSCAGALAIATSPNTPPDLAVDALHLAGRLVVTRTSARRVADVIDTTSHDTLSPVAVVQLEHLGALNRSDGHGLEAAAARFLRVDHVALAHESTTQAAIMHLLAGSPRQAGRCRAQAETMARGLRPTFAARRVADRLPLLTRREHAVVGLIADGQTLREAAITLGCSIRTAESHLQHAYVKLGVNDRNSLRALIQTRS